MTPRVVWWFSHVGMVTWQGRLQEHLQQLTKFALCLCVRPHHKAQAAVGANCQMYLSPFFPKEKSSPLESAATPLSLAVGYGPLPPMASPPSASTATPCPHPSHWQPRAPAPLTFDGRRPPPTAVSPPTAAHPFSHPLRRHRRTPVLLASSTPASVRLILVAASIR